MHEIFNLQIDKNSGVPSYKQLGDAICGMINEGKIKPNEKLPPIRKLSEALGVNNITIVSAYRYLENKKAAYARVGSGTYVSEVLVEEQPKPITAGEYHRHNHEFQIKDAINFANSGTSKELFPIEEFKLLFNQVLDRDKGNAFDYTDSQGYEPLREAVCTYLDEYGIKTSSDKIQIISGAQQGVDIISKAMLGVGDVLFVEQPTYYGAVGAFFSRGAQVLGVPIEKDGMDLDRLRGLLKIYRPKFIYVMTYFQTPTCVSYSMEKKRKLLELASEYDTYIIEEDNQSEFNYSNETIVPLKALDTKNRVIYIKSFSKILMPGLRLGFMVLPKKVLQQVMSAKYTTDIYTSGFTQRAFDLYLRSNGFKKHTEMMRRIFRERYEFMMKQIDNHLRGVCKYQKPAGGLSVWIELKNGISSNELGQSLLEKNVVVTPGTVFSIEGNELPFIRLSFADIEKTKILSGIKIIKETLQTRGEN